MAYSRQGQAITGRRQRSPARTGRPPYYTKYPEEAIPAIPAEREYEYGPSYKSRTLRPDLDRGYYRGMNKNDMMAAQEEGYYENIERRRRGEEPLTEMEIHQGYIDKFKIPDDTLSGLRRKRSANLPGGDMDISQGIPEGVSNLSGFPALNSVNEAGLAAQQGNVKGAVTSGLKGMLGLSPMGMPASIAHSIFGPPISKGYQAVKGALGFGAPANSGSAVASGTGISGLSGPMGLEGELADLDIGGFDGGGFGDIGDDGGSDLGEGFE